MSDFDNDQDYAQRKLVSRVVGSAFSNITDSIIDTHSAITVLSITVTAEIGGFVMLYFAKDQVNRSLAASVSDVWIYAALAIFTIGFLTSFAFYRLIADKWPHASAGLFIWLVSIIAGFLNILLFYALITFGMR